MNSSSIITILPIPKANFVKKFFDSTTENSNSLNSPRFYKSRGDIANQIVKLAHLSDEYGISHALDKIINSFFIQQDNVEITYDFLGQLLACDSEYQINHTNITLLPISVRDAVEKLRVQIYKKWTSLEDETIGEEIAATIFSERQLHKEVVYHIEKTTIKRIKTYFKEIDRILTRKLHDIEVALEKDSTSHKHTIESRKKIPDLVLKCKILSYCATLLGGGIISEISNNVGKVFEGFVSSTRLGENLKNYCYGKFNAVPQWNASLEYPLPASHSDAMLKFVIGFIKELRIEFLESLYSLVSIKFLAKQEQIHLIEELSLKKQMVSSEKFKELLSKRIHEKLNKYTYQYTDKIKEFGKRLIKKETPGSILPKLAYIYLLGMRMIKAPDSFQDIPDPLHHLQQPDHMEKVFQQLCHAGKNIVDLVQQSDFFETESSQKLLKQLGFNNVAESFLQEKASKYLGRESKDEKDKIIKRKLTILSWYIIPAAFIKHCHTFLPDNWCHPDENYKAIREIYDFLHHPIFKQTKPNILLTVLQDIPELNQMLKDENISKRIHFDYLKLESTRIKLPLLNDIQQEEPPTLDEIDEVKISGFQAHQERVQSYALENEIQHANSTLNKISKLIFLNEKKPVADLMVKKTILSKSEIDHVLSIHLKNDQQNSAELSCVVCLPSISYQDYEDTQKTKASIAAHLADGAEKIIIPIQIGQHWTVAVIHINNGTDSLHADIDITFYDSLPFREAEELLELFLLKLLPVEDQAKTQIKLINTRDQKEATADQALMIKTACALMKCYILIPRKLPAIHSPIITAKSYVATTPF
jgi:hypothetical protein